MQKNESVHSSCECYNDYHRKWNMCPSLSLGTVKNNSFRIARMTLRYDMCQIALPVISIKSLTWQKARANAAMTVSQNDIHMIGGRNSNGQLLKSVEYCEPGVIGKWKKVIG